MAKLAQVVYKMQVQRNIYRPVIVRFCGTTAGTIVLLCTDSWMSMCMYIVRRILTNSVKMYLL